MKRMSGSEGPSSAPAAGEADSSRVLRRSLRTIVASGCLTMVYQVGINSPPLTAFLREIGARELDFGLMAGLPLATLLLQFAGAAALNRVSRRRWVYIGFVLSSRLQFLGVALLPLALRHRLPGASVPLVIVLVTLSAALVNFAVPCWFSWMADLIPKRVINRVWGWRQRAMYFAWTFVSLAVTLFLYLADWPATVVFPLMTVVAVAAGATEVLLYLGVHEPPNLALREADPWRDGLAPVRHAEFRTFVGFSCFWSFATVGASAFMQLYVLKVLETPLWQTTLIWCVQGLGVAFASGAWGRIADRYGQRPVIALCVALKPAIVLVFLLLTPRNVVWLLPLAFFPDGMLNAGILLASNGYMLSIAPRENRSMFIAAITGLAGLCGGASAIGGGFLLARTATWNGILFGHPLNHYHLLFAASLLLRIVALPLAHAIREPGSTGPRRLAGAIFDDWTARLPRFPVGLYRRPE